MRVFLTGATGFIGSKLVPELLSAGHQVLGLTRSESGADMLRAAGAEPLLGKVEDFDLLRRGAEQTDAVIHTAFNHDDFSRFLESCETDRQAILAMGEVLAGSSRPMVVTSGVALGSRQPGEPATEDVYNPNFPIPRVKTEVATTELVQRGVNVSVVRLPQVHDTHKQGLVTYLIDLARRKQASAYIGEGSNRWSAGAVGDTVRLYRLVLERAEPGSRYHAVGEEGVALREIAEAIGNGLGIPVQSVPASEAADHFGFLAAFAGHDLTAKSAITREKLGWSPTGPTLVEDLNNMQY